ncbi:hypothetical protein [Pseudonocardia thermophila]|uniref:hypothetical protein n=1 Tax=Pseudonocardia thermophila TaxID=1848 RepID=UPI000936791E|nr:hypothetical protein [Pseudonocardia thermophila]
MHTWVEDALGVTQGTRDAFCAWPSSCWYSSLLIAVIVAWPWLVPTVVPPASTNSAARPNRAAGSSWAPPTRCSSSGFVARGV